MGLGKVSAREGVLVWIEVQNGLIAPVAREALGKARDLAAPGVLCGVIIGGEGVRHLAAEAIAFGADEVFVATNHLLEIYQSDVYPRIFSEIVRHTQPAVVIIGGSPLGRDLAPDVAARLDTGLTAHCIALSWEETPSGSRLLKQTVPGWGGNMRVDIVCPTARPQMATICPGVFAPAQRQEGQGGKVTVWDVRVLPEELRSRCLEVKKGDEANSLKSAEVIVAGGFGMINAGGFGSLRALAQALGAEIGGTRAAYDQGWIEEERMIGQSGVSIGPKMLIVAGASGAMHFTAGFSQAKQVIAIDRNPRAPIFDRADFGIVGDAKEIIEALLKELEP